MYKSGICDTKQAISLKRSMQSIQPNVPTTVSRENCVQPIEW